MLSRLRLLVPHLSRTMATVHNSNSACCSIPPVEASYSPKGSYKSLGGIDKVYVVGPDSGKALVAVYDIFGFWPQTLQGADILSSTLNAKVVMPDFFAPDPPVDVNKFPPKTDEEKQALQAFFGGPANPQRVLPMVKAVAAALKEEGVTQIGAYGYCWGGKICTLSGGENSGFVAVGSVHPAMLSVDDAKALTVPIGVFPSKDEPLEEYEKIVKVISEKPFASKNSYKLYETMHHGWAAARADLSDPENHKQYEDVYKRLGGFFADVFAK